MSYCRGVKWELFGLLVELCSQKKTAYLWLVLSCIAFPSLPLVNGLPFKCCLPTFSLAFSHHPLFWHPRWRMCTVDWEFFDGKIFCRLNFRLALFSSLWPLDNINVLHLYVEENISSVFFILYSYFGYNLHVFLLLKREVCIVKEVAVVARPFVGKGAGKQD